MKHFLKFHRHRGSPILPDFDYSYVYFVPDTNVIYPSVFLHNAITLPPREKICKKCFDTLKQRFNVKILPENGAEFLNLIYGKFHQFLEDIYHVAKRVKQRNQSRAVFEHDVWGQINAYGKDYGNLVLYWKINKDFFYQWTQMDNYSMKISLFRLIESTMQRYRTCVSGLTVSWTKENEENCKKILEVLMQERKRGNLPSDVDDIDLRIISGCFEYVDKYISGVLYLITNDNAACDSVKKAVKLESITGGVGKIRAGFCAIKPNDFLKKIE